MSTNFLNAISEEANKTFTENGAVTLLSSNNLCLDFFATVGALRNQSDNEIWKRFFKAYVENPDYAMKILFYARDIRGGLGERNVFRVILDRLAKSHPESVKKNLQYISEFGRWDDLLCLLNGPLDDDVCWVLYKQYSNDLIELYKNAYADISLLGKWLPSANTSSKKTVALAKHLCKQWGLSERTYRRGLTALRKRIAIIENNLRTKDYSFDYSKQPSRAMLKYRKAFIRNDEERYSQYLEDVAEGKTKMNTGALYPYDIVKKCLGNNYNWGYSEPTISDIERKSLDTTWKALEDFTHGENALCVVDGSGSMYSSSNSIRPIDVAMSLGIYFAERNHGEFHNHYITFSMHPRLVDIPEDIDIVDKVGFCAEYDECANTNIQAVFELILNTAVHHHIPQDEMPKTLYIISDMEFDFCAKNATLTNFQYAKKLFADAGYSLPNVVFWNVDSRNEQMPVSMNEQGVALVSGASPRIFDMVMSGEIDPMKVMDSVILSERYSAIMA